MKMFNKFQSPLGYQVTDDLIDTYGVDHSNFSARDEVEYQFARQNKENQLIQNYNNQGISDNYPQYGPNFWGNPNNNYGFGSSNIHDNIENRENQTEYVGNCTPFGIAKRAFEVYKMSNSSNPVKTGNKAVDFALGKIPAIKKWNTGFNLGKFGFVAQQTYNDTCKHKN